MLHRLVRLLRLLISTINKFQLFPNPSQSTANIPIEIQDLSQIQIQVMSLAGRILESKTFSNIQSFEHSINVSRFASGIYLVRVIVDGEVVTKKLIVE